MAVDLTTARDKLLDLIVKGVRQTKVGDKQVTYASTNELLIALGLVDEEANKTAGTGGIRVTKARYNRGS